MTSSRATERVPQHEARLLARTRWRLVALSAMSRSSSWSSSVPCCTRSSRASWLRSRRRNCGVEPMPSRPLYPRLSRVAISEALLSRRATPAGSGLPFDIIVAPDAAAPGFLFGGPASGTIAFVLGSDGLPLGLVGSRLETMSPDSPLRGPVPDAVQAALHDGSVSVRETEVLGVPVRVYTAPLEVEPAAVVQIVATAPPSCGRSRSHCSSCSSAASPRPLPPLHSAGSTRDAHSCPSATRFAASGSSQPTRAMSCARR